ncbi:FecR domain-containing protein [Nitrobacter sp. Nb-311A]|uniref:FecR domain-containing protein n=1 Tax=Nitrobacter sp. Nb-311A TaxID=314253 RepID=UPI0002DE1571|nr:FecR domain-containing protein [Nitrobacter sp. Nb-311A]
MSRAGGLCIAMSGAALALGGAAAQAQQVGTASAVNPAATANLKTIVIGQSIAHKERIQTKSSGSVQLLFLDKTSMTIGPNSDLTIDEYVYDPNANTGKLAATLGKGALRFVGGQISHNGDAEIKSASALIGIRGGVMMTDGKGGIYSGYGTMTVTSGGRTVTLGAGEFTQTQTGAPPTLPGLPPPGFVQQQIAIFQSAAGQTGGVRASAASAKNIAAAAQRATGSSSGLVTGSGAPPAPAPPPIVEQLSAITSAFTQSIQISNQAEAVEQIAQDRSPGNDHPPPTNNIPLPEARPSVTLSGYVGGLDVIPDNDNPIRPVSGTSEITLDAANNRVEGKLDIYAYDKSNPFTQLAGTIHALFQFGSKGSSGPANSAYVDYNNFYANTPDNSVVNGVPIKGVMVSANGVASDQIVTDAIPNLTPCQCDYTRWGFWQIEATSADTNTTEQTPREFLVGTWVAGRPVGSIGDVPTTGTATYTGHVIANVNNAGFVAGGFSNAVDFGARTGAVNVTNLDNTNYSGTVNFNTDPRNFGGTLNGDTGSRQMAIDGSFFQGVHSPVGEMGGRVGISGAGGYLGSGIFAATKQ